jgi:hypothetical protein
VGSSCSTPSLPAGHFRCRLFLQAILNVPTAHGTLNEKLTREWHDNFRCHEVSRKFDIIQTRIGRTSVLLRIHGDLEEEEVARSMTQEKH